MARIRVHTDDLSVYVELHTDDEGRTTSVCAGCGWMSDARPYDPIADHLAAAEIHLDFQHPEE